jgi:hypothetical protein
MMPHISRRQDQDGALVHEGYAHRPNGDTFHFHARRIGDGHYNVRIYDYQHKLQEEFEVYGYASFIEQVNNRSIVV